MKDQRKRRENWYADELLKLVQEAYPGWASFAHESFVATERTYKINAVQFAKDQLAAEVVQDFVLNQQYEALFERFAKVARKSNLLWLQVPAAGDLNLLYLPETEHGAVANALEKLLYGPGSTPERVGQFARQAQSLGWPCKWSFVTYYLFLTAPESQMFVKPRTMSWLMQFVGQGDLFSRQPTQTTYEAVLQLSQQLLTTFAPYGAQDMVDIQSLIWTAYRQAKERVGRLTADAGVALDVPVSEPDEVDMAEGEFDQVREAGPVWTIGEKKEHNGRYPLAQCAADIGKPEAEIQQWLRGIERKGQAIFYGPPGTGKTYSAKALARHLVAEGDGIVSLLQFHAGYSYEEFILGIRPESTADGGVRYLLQEGRFLTFCKAAAERKGLSVLIIDEINRAPLAQVFGELMYLLEYREESVLLAAGRPFTIPANVRILGTMNSADRSIALVDHALRRRFAFLKLTPDYQLLAQFQARYDFPVESLITVLQQINHEIGDPHYELGISFFLQPDLALQLPDIWEMEIVPYLTEYFFDRPETVNRFRWHVVAEQLL